MPAPLSAASAASAASGSALAIFEEHFASLGGYDRYRDTLAFVDSRLKRVAAGLNAAQLTALFGTEVTHINYPTFKALCRCIDELPSVSILETGSSAYGTNSSALFAKVASHRRGRFVTVDLNPRVSASAAQTFLALGCTEYCTALTGDSVATLRGLDRRFNVVYLDSFDLLPDRFEQSEQHGLAEFRTLLQHGLLDPVESYILIDDTPRSVEIFATQVDDRYLDSVRLHVAMHGRLPGKGALIAQAARAMPNVTVVSWEYQLLLRYSERMPHPRAEA
jgi:hypothetical protein